MLVGIIFQPRFITSQIPPPCTPELWPLNCPKLGFPLSKSKSFRPVLINFGEYVGGHYISIYKDIKITLWPSLQLQFPVACTLFFSSQLRIEWRFGNTVMGTGSTLTLTKVKLPTSTQSSEGEYLCEAYLGELQPVQGKVNLKITGRWTLTLSVRWI